MAAQPSSGVWSLAGRTVDGVSKDCHSKYYLHSHTDSTTLPVSHSCVIHCHQPLFSNFPVSIYPCILIFPIFLFLSATLSLSPVLSVSPLFLQMSVPISLAHSVSYLCPSLSFYLSYLSSTSYLFCYNPSVPLPLSLSLSLPLSLSLSRSLSLPLSLIFLFPSNSISFALPSLPVSLPLLSLSASLPLFDTHTHSFPCDQFCHNTPPSFMSP